MDAILKNICTRRSVRKFRPDLPPAELIHQVAEAGTYAASGRGRQSPIILEITDKKTRDLLSKVNAEIMGVSSDPFYGAPAVLVVLADHTIPTWVEDGSLVLGNLLLAASSIGLGSCWINRAREVFDTREGKELLRKWGLDPERYRGVGNCILGYPAPGGVKAAAPRKPDYVVQV